MLKKVRQHRIRQKRSFCRIQCNQRRKYDGMKYFRTSSADFHCVRTPTTLVVGKKEQALLSCSPRRHTQMKIHHKKKGELGACSVRGVPDSTNQKTKKHGYNDSIVVICMNKSVFFFPLSSGKRMELIRPATWGEDERWRSTHVLDHFFHFWAT